MRGLFVTTTSAVVYPLFATVIAIGLTFVVRDVQAEGGPIPFCSLPEYTACEGKDAGDRCACSDELCTCLQSTCYLEGGASMQAAACRKSLLCNDPLVTACTGKVADASCGVGGKCVPPFDGCWTDEPDGALLHDEGALACAEPVPSSDGGDAGSSDSGGGDRGGSNAGGSDAGGALASPSSDDGCSQAIGDPTTAGSASAVTALVALVLWSRRRRSARPSSP